MRGKYVSELRSYQSNIMSKTQILSLLNSMFLKNQDNKHIE